MALMRCLSKDVEVFVLTPPGSTFNTSKVLINSILRKVSPIASPTNYSEGIMRIFVTRKDVESTMGGFLVSVSTPCHS